MPLGDLAVVEIDAEALLRQVPLVETRVPIARARVPVAAAAAEARDSLCRRTPAKESLLPDLTSQPARSL